MNLVLHHRFPQYLERLKNGQITKHWVNMQRKQEFHSEVKIKSLQINISPEKYNVHQEPFSQPTHGKNIQATRQWAQCQRNQPLTDKTKTKGIGSAIDNCWIIAVNWWRTSMSAELYFTLRAKSTTFPPCVQLQLNFLNVPLFLEKPSIDL